MKITRVEDHSEGQVRADEGLVHSKDGQMAVDTTGLEVKLIRLELPEVFDRKYCGKNKTHTHTSFNLIENDR